LVGSFSDCNFRDLPTAVGDVPTQNATISDGMPQRGQTNFMAVGLLGAAKDYFFRVDLSKHFQTFEMKNSTGVNQWSFQTNPQSR
jgi:hypothetical protein